MMSKKEIREIDQPGSLAKVAVIEELEAIDNGKNGKGVVVIPPKRSFS